MKQYLLMGKKINIFFKKIIDSPKIINISKLSLLYLSVFLIDIKYWLSSTFGTSLKANTLISHILAGPGEIQGTDESILVSFVSVNIIFPALSIALIFYLSYLVTRDSFPSESYYLKSKIVNNLLLSFKRILIFLKSFLFKNFTPLALFFCSIIYFSNGLDLISFIQNLGGEDFFSKAYTRPSIRDYIVPIKKKNLILLYVESLEINLRNPNIYGSNLIGPIDELKGEVVPEFFPAPGTGWSIAGMVSSQCSVPTIPYLRIGASARQFLPSAICLGDILGSFGYEQFFLAASDLKFAGMDKFYKDHGYQHTMGKSEWHKKNLNETLFTGWGAGLQDDTLLEEAKKIIIQNNSIHQTYNLTLITTDNHAPNGRPSPRCSNSEKASGFQGTFRCTSRFIFKFVDELRKENLLKDTVVVIMGDHPFAASEKQSVFFPKPRYVYIKLISEQGSKPLRSRMTHFDVAPSILDLLGFNHSSEARFGLGISLFSKIKIKKYIEHFDLVTNNKILNHSKVYSSLVQTKSIKGSQ